LVVVIMSLVLATGLAAAGVWWFTFRPKPGVEPVVYARSVCSGVRDWQRDVDGQGSALTKSIARLDDLPAVRTQVVTYYTDLAARTDDLRAALTEAGVPDTPGGSLYADALVQVAGEQAAALRTSAQSAGRLDIKSRTLFQISLRTLLTNASSAVLEVTDALAHPLIAIPPDLAAALEADPTCTPYTG
jgi:hypothetical protein